MKNWGFYCFTQMQHKGLIQVLFFEGNIDNTISNMS